MKLLGLTGRGGALQSTHRRVWVWGHNEAWSTWCHTPLSLCSNTLPAGIPTGRESERSAHICIIKHLQADVYHSFTWQRQNDGVPTASLTLNSRSFKGLSKPEDPTRHSLRHGLKVILRTFLSLALSSSIAFKSQQGCCLKHMFSQVVANSLTLASY